MHSSLEADRILAELRTRPPYQWAEAIETIENTSPVIEVIKAFMSACLLDGNEVALVGELAGLDRHLAYERDMAQTKSNP